MLADSVLVLVCAELPPLPASTSATDAPAIRPVRVLAEMARLIAQPGRCRRSAGAGGAQLPSPARVSGAAGAAVWGATTAISGACA
jgi:hypothetical protein